MHREQREVMRSASIARQGAELGTWPEVTIAPVARARLALARRQASTGYWRVGSTVVGSEPRSSTICPSPCSPGRIGGGTLWKMWTAQR